MKAYKIILFLCNWAPHAAYQTLQDTAAEIPDEIQMIRIPCSGRMTKALLLRPFEFGADGVLLLGCHPGACRYGNGTQAARENAAEIRQILDLLGLGANRLQLSHFLPDQHDELLAFLQAFTIQIRQMGKSPIAPAASKSAAEPAMDTPEAIIAGHDVYACQDCGKCTSACPLALSGKPFSPRAVAADIIAGRADDPRVRHAVNACLTCGICYERCPSAVNFPEFIKDIRAYHHRRNLAEAPTHGGFFQSMMRTMAAAEISPGRWQELPKKIKTRRKSDVLFFGGCAPYFDIFFRKFLGVNTSRILEDSLFLLNFFGIVPTVLEDERCCGHDLLWTGDKENFLRLARKNTAAFTASGAAELITACPECHRTLNHDYAVNGVQLTVKVTHIHTFLEREINKGAVGFKPLKNTVTFQDACRQSRFDGREDLPRQLIQRMAGKAFKEMPDSGKAAICCGNSAWTGCDAYSKAMQVKRLDSAKAVGSDLMLTACPKCQIHLRCAMEDAVRGEELKMDIMDVTSAIAKTIYWE
ncbi:MAG: hydrogenase iron-sulfur subunit [Desulfobacteraceae bacterium]|jgi:Fe-S oxidoreductase/coenzyme F420-reducing hydrogenase delta subunit